MDKFYLIVVNKSAINGYVLLREFQYIYTVYFVLLVIGV